MTRFYCDKTKEIKETISIHIGECGIQLGNECWDLLFRENEIEEISLLQTFFSSEKDYSKQEVNQKNKLTPRALLVDLEPNVLDEIKTGKTRSIWDPSCMISGKEDSANNFARGRYTTGREIIDLIMEKIRRLCDSCGNLQGFFIYHSVGGGTGSGLTSLICQRLSDEYIKKTKIGLSIYPDFNDNKTPIVAPYNTVLTSPCLFEDIDVDFMFENKAIRDICVRNLGLTTPTYQSMNRVVAKTISDLTYSIRFGSGSLTSLDDYQSSLCPYSSEAHFIIQSYSPFLSKENSDSKRDTYPNTHERTRNTFQKENFLVNCDPKGPLNFYLSSLILFRGDHHLKNFVQISPTVFQRSPAMYNWYGNSYSQDICWRVPFHLPEWEEMGQSDLSVLNVCNNTCMKNVFERYSKKFDELYQKRSFVHWFIGEGMEEGEFSEAREENETIKNVYEEIRNEFSTLRSQNDLTRTAGRGDKIPSL